MKEKKPFYKKWWFWSIIAIIVVAIIVPEEENTDNQESNAAEEVNATEEDPVEEEMIIDLNKEITSADYTVFIERVRIEDNTLRISFDWENQSDWSPAHFELLGYLVVTQNDEELNDVSNDRKHKQIDRGEFDSYYLEYELIDESDISIRVVSASEYDGSEEEIIIEY